MLQPPVSSSLFLWITFNDFSDDIRCARTYKCDYDEMSSISMYLFRHNSTTKRRWRAKQTGPSGDIL